jgi:hypothetical protein
VGRVAVVAVVVAVAAVLAAVAAAAEPTRAQFIRQGDALCRQVGRELLPLRRQAEAAKSLPEAKKWAAVTRIWTAQIAIQTRFTARFRALGVPAHDAAARRIVSGLFRGLALARQVRDAFAARDTGTLSSALPEYLRFTLALNRQVAAYGFSVCGHG